MYSSSSAEEVVADDGRESTSSLENAPGLVDGSMKLSLLLISMVAVGCKFSRMKV